jgi:subtilisin
MADDKKNSKGQEGQGTRKGSVTSSILSPASSTGAAPEAPADPDPGPEGGTGGAAASVPAQVVQRTERYLMAPRALPGQIQPMALDLLASAVDTMPDVRIVKRLRPRGFNVLSVGGGGGTEILVTEMTVERGTMLQAGAPPNVIVETDRLLRRHDAGFDLLRASVDAAMMPAATNAVRIQLRVVGADGQALPNATVYLYGQAFPAQGKTDALGQVTLDLFGGPVETIQALYVKPERGHWERFIRRPHLAEDDVNTVALDPLDKSFPNFPSAAMMGWGQRLMGLDQLPAHLTGTGVRVGIIDSGCDSTHPQLLRATGVDLTTDDNSGDGWRNDEVHHGTHCAGIIGAASDVQAGIRGFAPGVELHAFKVFPGGRFSDLIDALDLCIARQIDVVNMSLGSPEPSQLVQQKIAEATAAGVACIVAAGNSAGPVQFPGVLPQVLTVAAIGQLGQFPADSYHAQTVLAWSAGAQNVFAAKFSCFGPEIRVCAPGVAIVSSVPGGYAAWDGTSMATPHVTGLAALVLAHHPLFQGRTNRTADRVAQLFQTLVQSAVPMVGDPQRNGAGMPLATRALAPILAAGGAAGTTAPQQPPTTSAGSGATVAPVPPQAPHPAGGPGNQAVPWGGAGGGTQLGGFPGGAGGGGAGGGGFGYPYAGVPQAAFGLPPALAQLAYPNAGLNYLLQLRARGLI